VLRGLHFQLENPQGKLVRPVSGTIFDVAVDLRRSSPTFAKWTGETLVAGDGRQLWIPPGFGHGFLVLSEVADICYKCTTVYHAASNCGVRWNDPDLAIDWPLAPGVAPILSVADAAAPYLSAARCFA
jgi:dTDP-4-dehydrorhamnose 3,5-epimerase